MTATGPLEGTSLLTVEQFDDLIDRLASVDPADGYPDGYDGEVLDAIMETIKMPADTYTDQECLAIIHRLVNHWSVVVDL